MWRLVLGLIGCVPIRTGPVNRVGTSHLASVDPKSPTIICRGSPLPATTGWSWPWRGSSGGISARSMTPTLPFGQARKLRPPTALWLALMTTAALAVTPIRLLRYRRPAVHGSVHHGCSQRSWGLLLQLARGRWRADCSHAACRWCWKPDLPV